MSPRVSGSDLERIGGLVSIIVPVYNRPQRLIEAVSSVLMQDYRSLEVIIVNDGSTDGYTLEAANSLAARHPELVKVHSIPNGGPGVAREHGRRWARGEFIQYLDSDDVLLPGKLTAQVAALRTEASADLAYGITLFRDARGVLSSEPHKDTGIVRQRMFPSFLQSRWWETATPLYRASVCELAGSWTDLRLEEDWEYDCRVASLGGRLAYVNFPVSEHRDHEGERLSRGAALAPARLVMRARAHGLIWAHAQRANLPESHSWEVARFARSLFLLARQCGAAGLFDESKVLMGMASQASGRDKSRYQIPIYRWLSWCAGEQRIARLSQRLDEWRALPGSYHNTPEARDVQRNSSI